ncbi:uncharacterized protein LOC106012583 [Aplysia californica]|uniref:Uncharacterized protein LOC106012583 n=1 Tax=Aplysia californica TaxID=6500 RepID=A0ABM1VXU4_APLCA|nr:uncharacterized protein LOC106012583 [Aplysia californica]
MVQGVERRVSHQMNTGTISRRTLRRILERGAEHVKVALYKGGVELHHITFDGSSSNLTSWFSPDRILDTSWDDPQNATYFALEAHRFLIYGPYNGCPTDYGWMLVVDSPQDNCPSILSNMPTWPRFIYSTATTRVTWSVGGSGVGHAEVFAVFVKLATR